jgi:hypothetical protein
MGLVKWQNIGHPGNFGRILYLILVAPHFNTPA